jgi:hypothetical protein
VLRTAGTLRNATPLVAVAAAIACAACASSRMLPDAPPGTDDAAPGDARSDARISASDGPTGDAAPADGPVSDGALDARPSDAAPDAMSVPDGSPDAGCGIVGGAAPILDGTDDLSAFAAAQQVPIGATLSASDGVALTWDPTYLYVTAQSDAFLGSYEPVHVYLQTGAALPAAVAGTGKEYSGLTPSLPFSATHVIALRQVTDSGTGPYDGVYTPTATWTTRAYALTPGADTWVSSDHRTLSAKVPWVALGGCPTSMRVAIHVVHAVAGNEWKDLAPTGHTPWLAGGGGYYQIDLTGAAPVAGWTSH